MEKIYAPTHLPFFECLKQVFVSYPKIYKPVFVLLLVFAGIHLLDVPLHHIYWLVSLVGFIVLFLAGVYLYSGILWIAHSVLAGKAAPSVRDALHHSNGLIFKILGGIILIFLIHAGLWGLSQVMMFYAYQAYMGIISLTLLLVISMLAALFFYFTLPLIILDRLGPFQALKRSAQLVYGHWWYCFGVMFFVFAVVAVIASLGFQIYQYDSHWISAAYDFIILMIVHPLYVTLTLTLLNEIKNVEKNPVKKEVSPSPA